MGLFGGAAGAVGITYSRGWRVEDWGFRPGDWGLRTEDSLFISYDWPHFHPLRPEKSSKILIMKKKNMVKIDYLIVVSEYPRLLNATGSSSLASPFHKFTCQRIPTSQNVLALTVWILGLTKNVQWNIFYPFMKLVCDSRRLGTSICTSGRGKVRRRQ